MLQRIKSHLGIDRQEANRRRRGTQHADSEFDGANVT
jgi:hypothetical protein